jgi:ATP-binding cassette, subfamily B, bacterial
MERNQGCPMDDICAFTRRPLAFLAHYIKGRAAAHGFILAAVLAAVTCSVGAQYGVKMLVDSLAGASVEIAAVWIAFATLASLIAADNLLWRVAMYVGSFTFTAVTGDIRRDLFRHLTGHAPSYFTDRLPGTLTSRITATSNAAFTVENMLVCNVLPPCVATLSAIILMVSVNLPMAGVLAIIAGIIVVAMFRIAAAGEPLHHQYAHHAASVDGEMIDVIGNMPIVLSFCGVHREHRRFDRTVGRELVARKRSLFYLERLRLMHAVVTVVLTIALVAWAILLWQQGLVTPGQVVLVCTLGIAVLHATRDLAVALVDATQHMARLAEALATLLISHDLRDHPEAAPLKRNAGSVTLRHVGFSYPDSQQVFADFNLHIETGQRVGLVGPSGSGKSTLFALVQRFYDVQKGCVLVGGENVVDVTQQSLRAVIGSVPQDISLFHRSILENVRYGRPDASDTEVLRAIEAARCSDFINALPEGVATVVGNRGIKLSPGQRQRLAIARAFLKDAPILLLDEATSALDTESEEAVRHALDRLMRGRTVIAIAHRLSTLRSFDRIVVLQRGQIVEDGPPKALVQRKGVYRDLVRREMARLAPQTPQAA